MIPTVKLMLVLATVLGVLLIGIDSTPPKGKKSGNPTTQAQFRNPTQEAQLRNAAQKALDAIGVNCRATASYDLAGKGQHVFNNGLNKFHYKVLKELLQQLKGNKLQLQNLMQDLKIPLNKPVQDAIGTWVATFSSGEYVDFNAHVFGEYVRELRKALVEYLKANTSDSEDERNSVQEKHRQRVQFLASAMVEHEVYVDPLARDRWLEKNQRKNKEKKMYDQVKRELSNMFQDILQAFQEVSGKIRDFRRNNWN